VRTARFLPLLVSLAVAAQSSPAPQELRLTVGRGELLQFAREVTKLSISEPAIADAVVISPKDIVVNAKGVGKTTLLIWEQGSSPNRYEIVVTLDLTDLEKELAAALPDQKVQVTGGQDKLVLTGEVKTAEDSKRAQAIASARAKEVVNMLTVPQPPARKPRQVLLQVKFASIDRTALSAVGFNFFSRNDKTLGSLSTQQFSNPRFSQLQFEDQDFSNSTINLTDILNIFAFRPDLNIGATIKMLQARNLLEILAEPNLIVLEGKEASFLAGGEFPFPVVSSTGTGGAIPPVVTIRFKEFGVRLNFAPALTEDDSIQMKVSPEVSALDFANAVTIQGFLIPAINTRRAETEVQLKEGESFAIAGLIDNRVVQSLNRIRGLGDIPIIGRLFRSSQTNKTNNELLVVVTPHLVKPLPPGETARLPEFTVDPVIPREKKKGQKKPEFVGPRGHLEPKK
jgi:pilus assembly protein CpaC